MLKHFDHLTIVVRDGAKRQSHEPEPADDDHGVEYFAEIDADERTWMRAPLVERATQYAGDYA